MPAKKRAVVAPDMAEVEPASEAFDEVTSARLPRALKDKPGAVAATDREHGSEVAIITLALRPSAAICSITIAGAGESG